MLIVDKRGDFGGSFGGRPFFGIIGSPYFVLGVILTMAGSSLGSKIAGDLNREAGLLDIRALFLDLEASVSGETDFNDGCSSSMIPGGMLPILNLSLVSSLLFPPRILRASIGSTYELEIMSSSS